MSFHLVDEPENVPLDISEDENIDPALNPSSSPTEMFFSQGFEDEEEQFGFVSEESPLATLPMIPAAPSVAPAATPSTIPCEEASPSS